ncbi:MAG: hypothetical protein Q9O62_07095, partial [Ardenticatenia bacterium]|nr:hypothetical protein [Ardenticatenia bacterium]
DVAVSTWAGVTGAPPVVACAGRSGLPGARPSTNPDRVLGLLPLLAWRRDGLGARTFWSMMMVFLILPWWVFLTTVVGDAEQPAAYLPVPSLALAALIFFSRHRRALRNPSPAGAELTPPLANQVKE